MPETPVTVMLYCPGATELLTANVSVLLPVVGFGEKDPVTPDGRPETARLTLPENPFCGFTYTLVVPELF